MDVREKLLELLADAGMGKTDRNFLADQLIMEAQRRRRAKKKGATENA